MPKGGKKPPGQRKDPATEAFERGFKKAATHPIFGPLVRNLWVVRAANNRCPPNGWAVLTGDGQLHVHPTRRGDPDEWAHAIAHCALHLGFGHFTRQAHPVAWQVACDCVVFRFLRDLKFGRVPEEMLIDVEGLPRTEERLYAALLTEGIPKALHGSGAGGLACPDMLDVEKLDAKRADEARRLFAAGLTQAVSEAVGIAAGRIEALGTGKQSVVARAREWFVSSYPLLGALAASFTLVEDLDVCHRLQIQIAAVDAEAREIYFNPQERMDEATARFVMAHELLHVGLQHQARRMGRDPQLWNVACDFVINGWLVEMGLGAMPSFGGLHDASLKGLSAEAVYDRIVTDLRRYRKLATFRGVGLGDLLEGGRGPHGDAGSLDDFYRRALSQGLTYHQESGRGLLPAGLVEEIRALDHPPLPWDVELAKWFDERFSPLERRRTYARLSRRQSSTPDIPRPSWVQAVDSQDARTYGVVLDTSGSMDRKLLAKALGAIASYSLARDVQRARVVFCDAVAYDAGYLSPDDIAGRVQVRGRGGTRLQPAIDLLETAEDFPKDGPILVITDGQCDRLILEREHGFLMPGGSHLPFVPHGKVFRIS